MRVQGRCYCGNVRYRVEGEPVFRVECFCRECQYVAGGSSNLTMGMPEDGFAYTQGEPKAFRRSDLERPVSREFCPECGTQILTRSPSLPGVVLLKVGTLDDPSVFDGPQMAIYTAEKQPFHRLPEGVRSYEGRPG